MVNIEITPGYHKDIILQCYVQGEEPAVYAADDTLSAEVRQAGQPAALFAPTSAWFTAKDPITGRGRQSGYEQGQVMATIAAAQSRRLTPTVAYFLRVFRAIAAAPGEAEEIAIVKLVVRRPAPGF